MKNSLLYLIFSLCFSCNSLNTNDYFKNCIITKEGFCYFRLNSSIDSIPLDIFHKVTDTLYYDEESNYKGKKYDISETEFVIAWYSENEAKKIYELSFNLKNIYTKDSIGVDCTIQDLYNNNSTYSIFDDYGELILVDFSNRIRYHLSNLQILSDNEINSLYQNRFEIDISKAEQIKVIQIDIFSFDE